ncbi:MAG: diacylglycerol kinase, partial [Bacteroidota bacterium]
HLLATIGIIFLGIIFPVSGLEATALVLCIGFVWVAELFNTVIEKIMDFISKEEHPQIKFIKDMSAAAVLIAAAIAVVVGCLVFIPKF